VNCVLIGYGKMGKEVERVAKERGIRVVRVFDVDTNQDAAGLTKEALKQTDVCIEFSTPEAVMENIRAVAEAGKNIVVGTTGWYDRLDEVRSLVKARRIGFLYASNFSLGVNIFSQIVMDAAHLFDRHAGYDVAIQETHHRGKADSPSGTALSLASLVLQNLRRKSEIVSGAPREPLRENQLHTASTRVGSVTGQHRVVFDSEADTIELVHTAKNRAGFALGAVVAAEWLKGKKGFFTMRDVLL
jgi:4-hydroxy-tetrahydrodipicolinate reductase